MPCLASPLTPDPGLRALLGSELGQEGAEASSRGPICLVGRVIRWIFQPRRGPGGSICPFEVEWQSL